VDRKCECVAFCKLKLGNCARVVSLDAESVLACRLEEMGLVEGTEFKVEKVAPLGDPVEISFRGQHLCLRKNEAECLQIEVFK
jgi:ferrous iron transport protein A